MAETVPAQRVERQMWRRRLTVAAVGAYEEAHANAPESLQSALRDRGVRNYSIFRDGLDVFGYLEVDNPPSGGSDPAQTDEVFRAWGIRMAGLWATGTTEIRLGPSIFYLA